MQFICDAADAQSWFRIETEGEAATESLDMHHAVEKFFLLEQKKAAQQYHPPSGSYFERDIALNAHLRNTMPLFATLRDREGNGLVTAMLPPGGRETPNFRIIIVGPRNGDPYPKHKPAIAVLGAHFGLSLERDRCFPYRQAGN